MQGGTDQDLSTGSAVAITRRPVGRFTDDRQLHTVVRADESVKHLAAVNADADIAAILRDNSVEAAADRLIESAVSRTAKDNVSVVVVAYVP